MLLERLAEELKDLAIVEQRPNLDGRNMTMMLGPSKAVLSRPVRLDQPTGDVPVVAADEAGDGAEAPANGTAAAEEPAAEAPANGRRGRGAGRRGAGERGRGRGAGGRAAERRSAEPPSPPWSARRPTPPRPPPSRVAGAAAAPHGIAPPAGPDHGVANESPILLRSPCPR